MVTCASLDLTVALESFSSFGALLGAALETGEVPNPSLTKLSCDLRSRKILYWIFV